MIAIAVGLGLICMGSVALYRPAYVMGYFGVAELSPELRNEVRAVYGGFGLAVGALLLSSLASIDFGAGVRLAIAVSLLGMAAGRVIAWCVQGTNRWPWLFGGVELLAGAGLLATLVTK